MNLWINFIKFKKAWQKLKPQVERNFAVALEQIAQDLSIGGG